MSWEQALRIQPGEGRTHGAAPGLPSLEGPSKQGTLRGGGAGPREHELEASDKLPNHHIYSALLCSEANDANIRYALFLP